MSGEINVEIGWTSVGREYVYAVHVVEGDYLAPLENSLKIFRKKLGIERFKWIQ